MVVTYPWNDETHVFSGISPHTVFYRKWSISRLSSRANKARTAINESRISANEIIKARLRNLFDGFASNLREQLSNIGVQGTRQERE